MILVLYMQEQDLSDWTRMIRTNNRKSKNSLSLLITLPIVFIISFVNGER